VAQFFFTRHRQCTAFMDVIRSGQQYLPKFGRPETFAEGETIYDYGDAPNQLYWVESGLVRTSVLSSTGKTSYFPLLSRRTPPFASTLEKPHNEGVLEHSR